MIGVTMNENMKSFIEGMILIVFCLLLLTLAKAEPTGYNLNYNIYPETNELTLQQGTDYTLYINYEVNTTNDLPFMFNTISPEGIIVTVMQKRTTFSDFTLPLYFHIGNIEPGKYPVELSTKVLYGGLVNERRTIFYVNVVKAEKVAFKTSPYTNEYPKLELTNISTRNLLLDANNNQTILLQFKNLGSGAMFKLNAIVDSEDKNKVHVSFNEQYFQLEKNESKNIIMTVSLDENYSILYTPIYLYALESTSKQQFDLGQINLTLKTQNIILAYTKETNTIELTNIGTDFVNLNIDTNSKEFSMILLSNQKYIYTADKNDLYANISINGKEYQEIEFVNDADNDLADDKKILPGITASVSGFFTLGTGSYVWLIILLTILLLFAIIYKLFLARNAVFGNHIYVKDLKLVDNKGAH